MTARELRRVLRELDLDKDVLIYTNITALDIVEVGEGDWFPERGGRQEIIWIKCKNRVDNIEEK